MFRVGIEHIRHDKGLYFEKIMRGAKRSPDLTLCPSLIHLEVGEKRS
jgi:hypothetical protein